MLTKYDFTYDNNPAHLMFAEKTGDLSLIQYIDRGVITTLEIESFKFNEKTLKLTVMGVQAGWFSDMVNNTYGPNEFTVDATSQESLEYFENMTYNYPKIKRQEVNGVAFQFLNMILFNPDTGLFDPQNIPVAPDQP